MSFSSLQDRSVRWAIAASLALHAAVLTLGFDSGVVRSQQQQSLGFRLVSVADEVLVAENIQPGQASAKPQKGNSVSDEHSVKSVGIHWLPAMPERGAEALPLDPLLAAQQAQRRQFRSMALSRSLAESSAGLASQIKGDHQCIQKADLEIWCDTNGDEPWFESLRQWIELASQGRDLGIAANELEIVGPAGKVKASLL